MCRYSLSITENDRWSFISLKNIFADTFVLYYIVKNKNQTYEWNFENIWEFERVENVQQIIYRASNDEDPKISWKRILYRPGVAKRSRFDKRTKIRKMTPVAKSQWSSSWDDLDNHCLVNDIFSSSVPLLVSSLHMVSFICPWNVRKDASRTKKVQTRVLYSSKQIMSFSFWTIRSRTFLKYNAVMHTCRET